MNCKICSSENVKYKFNLNENLKIYSCVDCEVEFMTPQLTDEEITNLYSESYYHSWGISGKSENETSKQMKIATFLLRLDNIRKYVASGNVLDIGCATGFYLEAAQKLNYIPYGIELSEYSSTISKNKFGEDAIFNGKLEECGFKKGFFNVISMFDLIEHVRDPLQTLGLASSFLTNNGIIIITTPNHSSLSNKLMGRKWTHYKKEHFFYFNAKSLQFIAKQNNLKIIHSEKSKKALTIDYLHTQLNVYKHWLYTPIINALRICLPKSFARKNLYFSIGEITVILRKDDVS